MTEIVKISDGNAEVLVSTRGAESLSWRVGEHPVLWQLDADVWPKTNPVLFPVVGKCRNGQIKVDGQTYPMSLHGFVATSTFEILERAKNQVVMSLVDSASTQTQYPFQFQLIVRHRIENSQYSISFQVINASDNSMHYALGIHPGFFWHVAEDGRRQGHLEFEHSENEQVPVISGGLFSADLRPTGLRNNKLVLNEPLLSRNALCFMDVRSSWVRFLAPGQPTLHISARNFPHFAIWTIPEAPFLSVESWTGHGDYENFDGELSDKPSMRILAPKESAHHSVTYELLEEAK